MFNTKSCRIPSGICELILKLPSCACFRILFLSFPLYSILLAFLLLFFSTSISYNFSFLTIPFMLAPGDTSNRACTERITWEYLGTATVFLLLLRIVIIARGHIRDLRKLRLIACENHTCLCLPFLLIL